MTDSSIDKPPSDQFQNTSQSGSKKSPKRSGTGISVIDEPAAVFRNGFGQHNHQPELSPEKGQHSPEAGEKLESFRVRSGPERFSGKGDIFIGKTGLENSDGL